MRKAGELLCKATHGLRFAQGKPIELIGGEEFLRMIRATRVQGKRCLVNEPDRFFFRIPHAGRGADQESWRRLNYLRPLCCTFVAIISYQRPDRARGEQSCPYGPHESGPEAKLHASEGGRRL